MYNKIIVYLYNIILLLLIAVRFFFITSRDLIDSLQPEQFDLFCFH